MPASEEIRDGLLGDERIYDQHDAGRNQHPENRATCNDANGEAGPVTEAHHFRYGQSCEHRRRGNAYAGDGGKNRICRNGRHTQAAAQSTQRDVGDFVNIPAQAGFADQQAHQHEERDDTKYVIFDAVGSGEGQEVNRCFQRAPK